MGIIFGLEHAIPVGSMSVHPPTNEPTKTGSPNSTTDHVSQEEHCLLPRLLGPWTQKPRWLPSSTPLRYFGEENGNELDCFGFSAGSGFTWHQCQNDKNLETMGWRIGYTYRLLVGQSVPFPFLHSQTRKQKPNKTDLYWPSFPILLEDTNESFELYKSNSKVLSDKCSKDSQA